MEEDLEPGRKLDKVVAETVFGFKVFHDPNAKGDGWLIFDAGGQHHPLYNFSNNDDDSYLVIKIMQQKYKHILYSSRDPEEEEYVVAFHKAGEKKFAGKKSKNLPHAICLAALQKVSKDEL